MSYYDSAAVCPYYRGTREKCISCEGLDEQFYHLLRFSDPKEKAEYFDRLCSTFSFPKCPYAKAQEKRYQNI